MALRIHKDNFEEKVLKNQHPVLVDFYSDSCVPCKMIAPVLGELEDDAEGQLEIFKVNTNFDADLAEEYDVKGTPTLLFFSQGELKDRRTGAIKKDDLYDWIKHLTGIDI